MVPFSSLRMASSLRSSLCSKIRTGRRRYLSTYYDSQSGLHLPVHDETEIKLIWNATDGYNGKPFVAQNLSKDRLEAENLAETLHRFVQTGIHGVILPPIKFPRDVRNLQLLATIAPPNFVVIANTASENTQTVDDGLRKARDGSSSSTLSKVLRYNSEGDGEDLVESLQQSAGLHTTLAITEDAFDGVEPIALANNVASTIDASNGVGCDYIWISAEKEDCSDTMVQICEELVYLDVAGATIKSRLLVDSWNEDMLEDILFAGVNKYVVKDESQMELVESVAAEQGKSLLRSTAEYSPNFGST